MIPVRLVTLIDIVAIEDDPGAWFPSLMISLLIEMTSAQFAASVSLAIRCRLMPAKVAAVLFAAVTPLMFAVRAAAFFNREALLTEHAEMISRELSSAVLHSLKVSVQFLSTFFVLDAKESKEHDITDLILFLMAANEELLQQVQAADVDSLLSMQVSTIDLKAVIVSLQAVISVRL